MDFIDEVRVRSGRFKNRIEHLDTEEATKTSLILPFLQMMGYDSFDPTEVVPEFTADLGTKRGEKVDYALMQGDKPIILIEAKKYGAPLEVIQESQLFRYFHATDARFAILTDGILYKFYSDLDKPNTMDERPFMVFNMLDFTDAHVGDLKRFTKSAFSSRDCLDAAREMKYMNDINHALASEMKAPSEEFVRFVLRRIEYSGAKNRQAIAMFTGLVQRAFGQFVNSFVDTRLKTALAQSGQMDQPPDQEREQPVAPPASKTAVAKPVEIGGLSLTMGDARATGTLEENGRFTVHAGALATKTTTPSFPPRYVTLRETMLQDGVLVEDGEVYRLTQDFTFNSSSQAAGLLAGSNVNGYWGWRDAEGRTLRELLGKQGGGLAITP